MIGIVQARVPDQEVSTKKIALLAGQDCPNG